jgi:formiminoglutamase
MSWPNLADLLRPADSEAPIALVGAPLGTGSVTPGGCDQAPARLRATLRRIGLYDIDAGRELSSAIADHGDTTIHGLSIEEATPVIRSAVSIAVERHALTLVIGGNNAVTRPALLALGKLQSVGLVTLDAHLDMRDLERGLSNGNPVRALIDDGLPGSNIAQVGLAAFANSRKMHRDALDAGNCLVSMADIRRDGIEAAIDRALDHVGHCEAILVDCDIDVIDRAQMPGAPGARAGGMAVEDFFWAVRALAAEPRVKAIDLTEWDPPLDSTDLSALTAARWVAECLAGYESR